MCRSKNKETCYTKCWQWNKWNSHILDRIQNGNATFEKFGSFVKSKYTPTVLIQLFY